MVPHRSEDLHSEDALIESEALSRYRLRALGYPRSEQENIQVSTLVLVVDCIDGATLK